MARSTALKQIGKNAPPKKILKQIQALQSLGKYAESKPLCDRLAEQGLDHPSFLHLYGLALRASGDLTGALVKVHAAHERMPNDVQILNSLAVIFLQLNELETAIELFKRTTQIDQNYYDGWKNLGIALRMAERYQAAQIALTAAHHLDPAQDAPLLALVEMLIEVRSYDKARDLMDKVLTGKEEVSSELLLKRLVIAARLQDFDYIVKHREGVDISQLSMNDKAALDNIWVFHLDVEGRYDEAIEILEERVREDTPHRLQLKSQLGMLYAMVGRIDDAIGEHEDLLREDPDNVAGRYNLANLQFRSGDLANAYRNYESRWLWKEFPTRRRRFDAERYEGQPLDGKTLLVWKEQGIGDEVRFASLLTELEDHGEAVTFECSPKLVPLFEHAFPWATIRPEGPYDCRGEDGYETFDYQTPVGSLAPVFRPTIEDFEKQSPWIPRFTGTENRVREQLGVAKDEVLVGICWRSQNQAASRDRYFFDCEQLVPLKQLPNAKWLNVQYDAVRDELDTMREQGLPVHHYTNVDQKDDLVTACGLLGACDIVITIGGAVGDLSGALGVPMIYITNVGSDVFLGTDRVPWFPNAKSFPIKPYGGDAVIGKIIEEWPSIVGWANGVQGERPAFAPGAAGESRLDVELEFPAD